MPNNKFKLSKAKSAKQFLAGKVRRKKAGPISDEQAPRVTNETVIQHREEVLSGARKYIYPLSHSRHKIVMLTVSIAVVALIAFMSYTMVSLYKVQATSAFIYQVTKVVPLPIARIGGTFVSYENYLFELRHYIHYFENQQDINFSTEQGKAQLTEQRKKTLENVVNLAYIKKIAQQKDIKVSGKEIDDRIDLLKKQNKLGDSKVFEDVLKKFWGWSPEDFRRSIYQDLLKSKVQKFLDVKTQARADQAAAEIKAGGDFGALAKKYSDDTTTKDRGGEFGFLVSQSDTTVPPQTIDALYKLKEGEVSGIVDLGYGLEIVKNLGSQDGKIRGARIFFAYQDINILLNDYKDKQKAQVFIKIN
jgi:parvulin-like peptidyl-prolyl isomerase